MRRRTTWVLAAAPLIVGLAVGVDALRHDENPPPAEAGAITTTQAPTTTNAASLSHRLVGGRVVKLAPGGPVSADLLGMNVSFKVRLFGVNKVWYGYEDGDETRFAVVSNDHPGLRRPNGLAFSVAINGFDLPLSRAGRQVESAAGVSDFDRRRAHIGVRPALSYRLFLTRSEFDGLFGLPAKAFKPLNDNLNKPLPINGKELIDVLLIGAQGKTFLIRIGHHFGYQSSSEIVSSLRFAQ